MQLVVSLIAALAFAASGLPQRAAGPAAPVAAGAAPIAASAEEVRVVLDDARTAAQTYGRRHLGHYRKLNHRRLVAQGFDPRPNVRLAVYVTHTAYCFTATHTGLPAADPRRTASLDSRTQRATPGDGCAARATTERGAAWVCKLPGAEG